MFKLEKKTRIKILLGALFLSSFLFLGLSDVLAYSGDTFGINEVDSSIVLKKTDPRRITARILNVTLGLLGIIAVSLIIYAGFTWMTSEGNEEKITKAKGTLKSAVIGLIIILSAWGIVYFIFKELGEGGGGDGDHASNEQHFQEGLGSLGVCTVESVYPEPGQRNVPRNTMIMITFKEEVSPETIGPNTTICPEEDFSFDSRTCADPVEFSFDTNDNLVFVIFPNKILGNENSDSSYVVYLSNDVLNAEGTKSIFNTCSPQYLLWNFIVSTKLDLTPPQVENIFPREDNQKDYTESVSDIHFAKGSLLVTGIPKHFEGASVVSVTRGGGTEANASATVNQNYNGAYTDFSVSISASKKAQLSSGSNSLGAFEIINGQVDFPNYFLFEVADDFESGNSWSVSLKKVTPADKIKVGSYEYTFTKEEQGEYDIKTEGSTVSQAQKICSALNNHPNVEVLSCETNKVVLEAKSGGASGNTIFLQSYSSAITASPFSGGADKVNREIINDKKDKPMNSAIQINFNEAINPLTVTGTSEDVKDYIRVINLSDDDSLIDGKFVISSNYKTVEFVSNNKCGANSCGEDIFCLPPNSNIKVEIVAAELFNCESSDTNCLNKSPFISCVENICQNEEGKRYPLSKTPVTGITDSALNSLDGNRDSYAYGPVSYYNENQKNPQTGDSYSWSFWINDKIDATPPVILEFSPGEISGLSSPIEMTFNKLLLADSLRTGQSISNIGGEEVSHSRINLISGQLVGYWVSSEGLDVNPRDGENDQTRVYINHAKFFEGASYRSQAGSGVRDIYQNCFKPSASISCVANASNPSCCDGVATPSSVCN